MTLDALLLAYVAREALGLDDADAAQWAVIRVRRPEVALATTTWLRAWPRHQRPGAALVELLTRYHRDAWAS